MNLSAGKGHVRGGGVSVFSKATATKFVIFKLSSTYCIVQNTKMISLKAFPFFVI